MSKRRPWSDAVQRRVALYKAGKWREALAELPGWEDAVLDNLKQKKEH